MSQFNQAPFFIYRNDLPSLWKISSVWLIFRLACGTMSFSDFCWTIGPCSFVLRPTGFFFFPGVQQISLGKTMKFQGYPVINTCIVPTNMGFCCREPTYPLCRPYDASLSFETLLYLWLPLDIPSRVEEIVFFFLTLLGPVNSGLCPCLVGIEFPSLGPQVRTFVFTITSNFSCHARRTRSNSVWLRVFR